jgi:hypothetical protein
MEGEGNMEGNSKKEGDSRKEGESTKEGKFMRAPGDENGEEMRRRECCRPHFIRMIGDTSGSGSS